MGTDSDLEFEFHVQPYRPVSVCAGLLASLMTQTLDFETFFATSLDLLVIRDAEFKIVKVNQAWEKVLGYRAEELEGQPMLSFIHPDDVAASHSQMRRVETEKDVTGVINRYRCRDGGYRYLEWRAHQEGNLVYGVARDVTERLAIEVEMAEAKAAAETASKAKSEFLANMSHEIRTPLNGVIGLTSALAQTELSAQQREMVDLILTSGQTLERVVSDVLDFSKIEAGRLELDIQPFDLRPQLEGLADLFRARAEEKGLTFSVTCGAGVEGWFCGDVVRIKQVLGNLVSNAVKFTTQGKVRVVADVHDRPLPDAPVLTLKVLDTGIGFDNDVARRLFQRFSQADGSITRRFGGSGLGLSICQALVEMMGGEVRATSEPGRGSEFEVNLPLPRHQGPSPAMPAGAANGVAELGAGGEGGPLRVLLAEDHVINQRLVEVILGPMGVNLTKAETGDEALRAYMTEDFELVLMDMQMPVMDGWAATRAIRDFEAARPNRRRTPIVMLSANAMRQHVDEAIAAGADFHLAKPVSLASLRGAVARALNSPSAG
jgi:PAS domain S-box-containing protein